MSEDYTAAHKAVGMLDTWQQFIETGYAKLVKEFLVVVYGCGFPGINFIHGWSE
jgi:hypothetical protein